MLNTAAYMIHSAIHAARPDVLCAAHTHSIHGKSFSSSGVPLDMLNQDSCAFYDVSAQIDHHCHVVPDNHRCQDIVLYNQFNGVVLDEDEGKHIAETLGTKKVISGL